MMYPACRCGTASQNLAAHHSHGHLDGHDHDQSDCDGEQSPGQPGKTTGVDRDGGLTGASAADLNRPRTIAIDHEILAKNDAGAEANRNRLRKEGVFALNLVSSLGSGKTSLLVRIIAELKERWPIAVIECDQRGSHDAQRIRATGVPAMQVNIGRGSHLDAHMIGHALEQIPLESGGLLFIENVGDMVGPAHFDLGETAMIVVLAATGGEAEPLEYPEIFAAADLMLLNKSDLLPHLDFDVDACLAAALRVNPRIQILTVSARTGQGFGALQAWIEGRAAPSAKPASGAATRLP